jgi:hypothetical protein
MLGRARTDTIVLSAAYLRQRPGSIAQLVEHFPYKEGVSSSSLLAPTGITASHGRFPRVAPLRAESDVATDVATGAITTETPSLTAQRPPVAAQ